MKIADFCFHSSNSSRKKELKASLTDKRSFEERFCDVVRRFPDRPALQDAQGSICFNELAERSAAIAAFIIEHSRTRETPVAVMCGRDNLFMTAALGILRAGAMYVPLDPALPMMRRREMMDNCQAALLITEASLAGDAGRLYYECPHLERLLCLDAAHFGEAVEKPGDLMALELWSHVTAGQEDGSWKSLFDGKALSDRCLQDMAANVVKKNSVLLNGHSRVLDVGSGAGTVARALLARCSHYTAVDLSRTELDRIEGLAKEYPLVDIATHQFEAIDINLLPADQYDLLTLNSVIENFPGFNYLRRVLDRSLAALREGGTLFLGCVWDLAKKDDLLAALHEYGNTHDDVTGLIRLEGGEELFVPKEFFREWAVGYGTSVTLEFSEPDISEAELSQYRYDVSICRTGGLLRSQELASQHHGTSSLQTAAFYAPVGIDETNAAYCIYTSGSTGTPKGVVIEHGSLLNLNDALKQTVYHPQWQENPVNIALLASFCFDASIQQILPALLEGHTLHIVPDSVRRDPQALHEFLEQRSIVLCDGTPSLFGLLLEYWAEHDLNSSISTFILGGEALRRSQLERFFAIGGHEKHRIFNGYGPTECCVDSTLQVFTHDTCGKYDIPPIGTPLINVELSIRDANAALLPDGIPGELWISGLGLSRGYFNDPVLTAERFVSVEGCRWYRSGDIVRRLADGCYGYVNRLDHQVKIRGYRIELGEVETLLNRCPLVDSGVVVADDFAGNGETILAAYIVSTHSFDKNAIKAYLAAHLPAHAVPAYFVAMEQLPLTQSAKIDRSNLPSPLAQNRETKRNSIPLQGDTEKLLADIWSQLLGVVVADSSCDFFEIGGHSVLAVRMISLIEKHFGQRIPLSDLFLEATIAALAKRLAGSEEAVSSYTPVLQLSAEGTGTPIFLFHPVGGNVLCYKPLATDLAGAQPIYAIEAPGADSDWPELPTVEAMANSYLRAVREVVPQGPYILVGWSFGGLVAFEVARQCTERGIEIEALILLDAVADTSMARDFIKKDEAEMLRYLFQGQISLDVEKMRKLNRDERINYLIRAGEAHGLLPSGFGEQRMRHLLQTYHVNGLAASRYEPRPCSLKALLVRPESLSGSTLNIPDDLLQGWGQVLQGGVELCWVPGNHESMLMEHTAPELARLIKDYMAT